LNVINVVMKKCCLSDFDTQPKSLYQVETLQLAAIEPSTRCRVLASSFAALQHSWALLELQRTLVDAGVDWLGAMPTNPKQWIMLFMRAVSR
jgi:hypothetical protein